MTTEQEGIPLADISLAQDTSASIQPRARLTPPKFVCDGCLTAFRDQGAVLIHRLRTQGGCDKDVFSLFEHCVRYGVGYIHKEMGSRLTARFRGKLSKEHVPRRRQLLCGRPSG